MSNVYILALVLGFIVEVCLVNFIFEKYFFFVKLFSLNVARFEENGFAQAHNGLANTYFVKTLFHLFK